MSKIFLFLVFVLPSLFGELPTLLPPALHKGDLIALVFPGAFLDTENEKTQEILNQKEQWLQRQGFRTIFYPQKVQRDGYLAGKDEERAQALMDAWKNNEVKAIWCFRGGYGSQRILDSLDYETIKTHPKIFIGMSDITALHQAIQCQTGLVTFLAPVLKYFGDPESSFQDQYALTSLENILERGMTGEIPLPHESNLEVLNPGTAVGTLVGGNLSLISSLCGTKWQVNTDGKILLLEDVGEGIYRIDRMLWQLKESGLLERPAAVILGSFVDCTPMMTYSLTLEQVFDHYFKKAKYPVIRGFPSGHDRFQTTLPLNARIEIDTEKKRVNIVEPSVNK